MAHLRGILDRLNSPNVSRVELGQREVFLRLLRAAKLSPGSRALSVSCGDGVWDYLALRGGFGITAIDATDVVDCPVRASDQRMLAALGQWRFHKVAEDGSLPFGDEVFDVVFHQDVVEHTERPHTFIGEQYRVLRAGGGTLIAGTPNLLRPMNLVKALTGRLHFPTVIGHNEELGNYVHVQEFHAAQLQLLLEEAGFSHVTLHHVYFGLSMSNICLSLFPKGRLGKTLAHFIMARAVKA